MRGCENCTACCSGVFRLTVNNKEVYGSPCEYVCETGCSLHNTDKKPEVCQSYQCLWSAESSLPDWMKPSESGVIIDIIGKVKESAFMRATCVNKNISAHVFAYILYSANRVKLPLQIRYINDPDSEDTIILRLKIDKFLAHNSKLELEYNERLKTKNLWDN